MSSLGDHGPVCLAGRLSHLRRLCLLAEYARVVFLDTTISDVINKAIWEEWSTSEPNTEDILFAEYDSTGPGVEDADRPSFVTILTASEAAAYTISNVLGSDYTDWVDTSYL